MESDPPHEPDPDLDEALVEAFKKDAGNRPPESVLAALQIRAQSTLGVHLDSAGLEEVPVRVTDEAKALRDPSGRYQILGEVGRGGVGIVYKGRDQDLGRDVAMKVLKDEYAQRPDVLARFVEEAQIGGQLQHPGIVPVYELGLQAGERPYFAMKLVKGETLAAKLAKRRDPGVDRRRFLGVFEQVCQTLAYAHARQVVHRDLKPANVMIGAFGEVQVVDWGFAKVLPSGGSADEKASLRGDGVKSVIETVRSTPGSGSQSVVGSMMGTPAYMPPEQALGDIDNLDPRSDVFGLGAILCEILTGDPPYREQDGDVIRQAAAARLDPVYERIRESGSDQAMITLCIECLSRARHARPSSAQELADRVSDYLTSVEERARDAELRVTRARYRQRTTVLSMVAAFVILVVGGVAWWWVDAAARRLVEAAVARVAEATGEAREALARASSAGLDAEKWRAAVDSAARVEALVGKEELTAAVRQDATRLVAGIRGDARTAGAEIALRTRDAEMLERLVTARIPTDDDVRSKEFASRELRRLDAAYRDAFAFYLGKPLPEVTTEAALASMRKGRIQAELAAALDHLGLVRDHDRLTVRLREIAMVLDPGDTWRSELREALAQRGFPAGKLQELAERADFGRLTATHCLVLGQALKAAGRVEVAMHVLRRGRERYPQDFSLAFELAVQQEGRRDTNWDAVVSALDTARAIAPEQSEVLHRQGMALEQSGRHADAERVFRMLSARDPTNAHWASHVASALNAQGKTKQAEAGYRRAIAANPTYPGAHNALGVLLQDAGDLENALASFQNALAADPEYAAAHNGIGTVLILQGKFAEAVASFQRAIALDSHLVIPYGNLSEALRRQGKLDEARAVCEKALALDANNARVLSSLGNVQKDQHKLDDAIVSYRRSIASNPRIPGVHRNLARAYLARGRKDEALASLRRAVDLAPGSAAAHYELAMELQRRGELEEAIASYERLVAIDPKHSSGYNNLGAAYSSLGRIEEAIAACRKAVAASPDAPIAIYGLSVVLEKGGWLEEAIAGYRKAASLFSARTDAESVALGRQAEAGVEELAARLPALQRALAIVRGEEEGTTAQEWFTAADLAQLRSDYLGAVRTYARGFTRFPASTAESSFVYNAACAAALAAAGRGTGAAGLSAERKAELWTQAHTWLASDLLRWRRDESADAKRRALAIDMLEHWLKDPDLAGVRGDTNLAALPAGLAAKWRRLWTDHAAVLKQWREAK